LSQRRGRVFSGGGRGHSPAWASGATTAISIATAPLLLCAARTARARIYRVLVPIAIRTTQRASSHFATLSVLPRAWCGRSRRGEMPWRSSERTTPPFLPTNGTKQHRRVKDMNGLPPALPINTFLSRWWGETSLHSMAGHDKYGRLHWPWAVLGQKVVTTGSGSSELEEGRKGGREEAVAPARQAAPAAASHLPQPTHGWAWEETTMPAAPSTSAISPV